MPSKFKKVAVLRLKTTVDNTTEADAVRQGGHVQVGDERALAVLAHHILRNVRLQRCSDGLRGT